MNLIIATTPFQMLIAKRIMELHPAEEFHFVVLTSYCNKKYKFYYNKVKNTFNCREYDYIKTLPKNYSKLFTLYDLIRLRIKSLFYKKYNKVFLANLESIWVQTFISYLYNKTEIYTYDDGTANILTDSYLYKEDRLSGLSMFFLTLIGNKYSLSELKKQIVCHFTIYNMDNIVKNTKYIDIISLDYLNSALNNRDRREVNIFIGQPLYDYDISSYNKLSEIIELFNIELYFPHPREKVGLHKNIQYIYSELLFEDYIFERLKKENGLYFNIYTIYSGTILNLLNIPNIKVNAIKLDNTPKEIRNIYKIFSTLGVNVINYS